MNLLEMTRGGNSKYSQLSVAVSPSDTSIPVQDISYFEAAPNYATIGVDNDAEVVYYTGVDTTNSMLTGCVRGQSGTVPNVWPVSTYVYNAITSTLINNMEDNITTLSEVINGSGLLINSNFSVWQRATSYTVTSTANYGGPDRWKFKQVSGTPVISQLTATSGLKCTGGSCTMMYLMDTYDLANVSGQVCTLSYKLNGAIKTTQLTPSSQTVVSLTLANGDQLEWVKLELGDQATEYRQPNYVENLLDCMRYFKRYNDIEVSGTWYNSMDALLQIRIIVPMRISPTVSPITVANAWGFGNSYTGKIALTQKHDAIINMVFTATTGLQSRVGFPAFADGIVDLDAEL